MLFLWCMMYNEKCYATKLAVIQIQPMSFINTTELFILLVKSQVYLKYIQAYANDLDYKL